MSLNSNWLIIGYCNINNALVGDCREMCIFFFFLIENNVSPCVVFRIFFSLIKFLMSRKPKESTHDALLMKQKLNC